MLMERKIFFKNDDGMRLCGVLTSPGSSTRRCIVLCHGITCNKDNDGIFVELARRLSVAGFAVFRFDFRAHGESEGDSVDLTVSGEKVDLEAAVAYLQRHGYRRFGILASSFGGGPVSLFASEHPKIIMALVMWNAAIDYHTILTLELPFIEKHLVDDVLHKLDRQGYVEINGDGFKLGKKLYTEIKNLEPWKSLRNLPIPILFIHGDQDRYVPYDDSVKYSQMFRNAKLKTIHGAHHGLMDSRELTEEADEAAIHFFVEQLGDISGT